MTIPELILLGCAVGSTLGAFLAVLHIFQARWRWALNAAAKAIVLALIGLVAFIFTI